MRATPFLYSSFCLGLYRASLFIGIHEGYAVFVFKFLLRPLPCIPKNLSGRIEGERRCSALALLGGKAKAKLQAVVFF
ncbi:hypothetical protein ASE92_14150 [Pedobacter sp. Leaf41]|nr:hypothetical protein ASE92_14150 [Pedobacter sp. Leaf41]